MSAEELLEAGVLVYLRGLGIDPEPAHNFVIGLLAGCRLTKAGPLLRM